MAPNRNESRWIFGLHDAGGEQYMLDAKKPGWIVFSEAIGADPKNRSGRDFRPYSSRELGVICRLNHGYYPDGTLPFSGAYAAFAQRCANFASASPGCHHWIIGNEPNYSIERPTANQREIAALVAAPEPQAIPEPPRRWWERLIAWLSSLMRGSALRQATFAARQWEPSPVITSTPVDDPFLRSLPERFSALQDTPAAAAQQGAAQQQATPLYGEILTPTLYARCYRLCRNAIRSLPGHEDDQVLVAGPAPWNNQTTYRGNERGDWVRYLADVLEQLGSEGCDGMALHVYAHGSSPRTITSDAKMNPPFEDRYYNFRVYRDFLGAVPPTMRQLPVFITETDQVDAWLNDNTGWVQKAYAEIDDWNRIPGSQIIHALALYRWPRYDRWYIDGKQGVVADWQAAMTHDYRWDYQSPLPAGFRTGDLLKLVAYVNLRRTPGYIAKTADDLVTDLKPGQTAVVLDESSTVVDGLVWWRVRLEPQRPVVEGWLAQTGPDGMPLVERVGGEPSTPTAPPPVTARLKLGDRVRTTTIVNARRTPGHMNKPDDDIVHEVPMGTVLVLADGPQIADGLVWWIGEDDLHVRVGWLAESAPTGAALLEVDTGSVVTPPTPTEPVARFKPGDRVMTVAFVRLRRTPGFLNKPPEDVIAEIWQGTAVTIVAGPEGVDDLVWWEVDTQDITGRAVRGWMAESAPGGMPLLGDRKDEDATPFKRGELAMVGPTPVLIRRTAGYINKPDDDVLGEFAARTTVYFLQGPRNSDGLSWWRASGVTRYGALTGWVAQGAANGATLVGRATKLPGTSIPDIKQGSYLGAPFVGQFGISQLWGEHPEVYARYTYDGVALLGHNGIDFLTPMGTPVVATDGGEVVMTGFEPDGFGNYVLVAHAWGQSMYAHLETIGVGLGQQVERGSQLGSSGNSGGSTGPHLHFAIRIHPFVRSDGWGGSADPLPYMNPSDVQWPPYMLDATSQVQPGPGGTPPIGDASRLPPPRMADDAPDLIRP